MGPSEVSSDEAVVRALALTAASFQAGDPVEALVIADKYLVWIHGGSADDLPTPEKSEEVDLEKVREQTARSRAERKAARERDKLEGVQHGGI